MRRRRGWRDKQRGLDVCPVPTGQAGARGPPERHRQEAQELAAISLLARWTLPRGVADSVAEFIAPSPRQCPDSAWLRGYVELLETGVAYLNL